MWQEAIGSAFKAYAAEKELQSIIVETQSSNRNAMGFYLSNGFRLCGFNGRYCPNKPLPSKDIAIFFPLDL